VKYLKGTLAYASVPFVRLWQPAHPVTKRAFDT
jgi:hypothetical protein